MKRTEQEIRALLEVFRDKFTKEYYVAITAAWLECLIAETVSTETIINRLEEIVNEK